MSSGTTEISQALERLSPLPRSEDETITISTPIFGKSHRLFEESGPLDHLRNLEDRTAEAGRSGSVAGVKFREGLIERAQQKAEEAVESIDRDPDEVRADLQSLRKLVSGEEQTKSN
jgi:hypothetical protein